MYSVNEVELILMDKDFRRLRAIRAFSSLRWTERYYDDGEFELCLPARYTDDALSAAYVYRKDKQSTGVILNFKKEEDEITISGAFLEELLKMRVLDAAVSYEGLVHNVCRNIVNDFCILAGNRRIPKLKLGEAVRFDRSVSLQQCGKTVCEFLREILTEQEASFRLRYEIEDDTVYFDIVKGLDRTESQSENPWCLFSQEYFNIIAETYEQNEDTRNVAYVVGRVEKPKDETEK